MTKDINDITIYRGQSEWSALYVDGKLDRVGDHYLIEERLIELAGAAVEHSDDFLRGGDSRDDVAKTLDEIDAYVLDRSEKLNRALDLRAQAARLIEQAESFEKTVR